MAIDCRHVDRNSGRFIFKKFKLYETQLKFYMVGRDKSKTVWRVLKIDRSEPSELTIYEDPAMYTQSECNDLLKRVDEGNKSNGGLRFVTDCYGIVGFVKFLGPYYMLLITERTKIGVICGHAVYAVSKSKMIPFSNTTTRPNMAYSKDENRYKKLLRTVDLTKDFFFSYSYHIMQSLQRNLCDQETGQVLYETMFVWNEFLTRGFRKNLISTMWTVALAYGFFKQDWSSEQLHRWHGFREKLSVSGKGFCLTLIARRSRHFAGTRYLKRGVNEKGRVANDVETEQIVFDDIPGGIPSHISSVVQNRGSIPLFWSQESSWLNIKPDIILRKDQNYEATRLHFDNLVKRYGNPIIILNLIKASEKKPRESILRAEFAKAIDCINKSLPGNNHLRFFHWDLHNIAQKNPTIVLPFLGKVAAYALNSTGFFYCQVPRALGLHDASRKHDAGHWSCDNDNLRISYDVLCNHLPQEDKEEAIASGLSGSPEDERESDKNCLVKPPIFQSGVLRTNCIDCLDRTNVAQYAYGLAALGRQLHALDFIDDPDSDLDASLANELMCFYEKMGDTLAFQYGGSAAHNKIFSVTRGQWKAAAQSQEFIRTLQRYYSNAYMDPEKQDAINIFLGYFQPQQGKPALWELDSDQHYNIGRRGHSFTEEKSRSFIKRSLSDGNILSESSMPVSSYKVGGTKLSNSVLPARLHHLGDAAGLSDSTPEMLTCESDISYSRCTPIISSRQLFADSEHNYFRELRSGVSNCSNFLDFDCASSSGNSCDEEIYERSSIMNSPVETLSTEDVNSCIPSEINTNLSAISIKGRETTDTGELSGRFIDWVSHGETLWY